MEYLSKIELINKKIEFYDSWIDIPKVEKYKEAIGLFLFYEKDLDQMNKDTLILFLKANLKFNTKTIIYIFTNLDLNLNGFALERVKVTFIPFQDNQIMTNRVVFNFIVTKKFTHLFFDAKTIYALILSQKRFTHFVRKVFAR